MPKAHESTPSAIDNTDMWDILFSNLLCAREHINTQYIANENITGTAMLSVKNSFCES